MIDQQEADRIWTKGPRALLAGLAEVDAPALEGSADSGGLCT